MLIEQDRGHAGQGGKAMLKQLSGNDRATVIGTIGFCLFLIAAAIYVWVESAGYTGSAQMWPRALATALAVAAFGVAGITVVTARRAATRGLSLDEAREESTAKYRKESAAQSEATSEDVDDDDIRWRGALKALAGAAVFVLLGYFFTFVVAVPVYVFGTLLLSKYRRRLPVLIGVPVGTGLAVYLLFGVVANIPVDAGVFYDVDIPGL